MSSGKYSAISGAMGRMEKLNSISEQLAALKTPGYKKGITTFAARLGEANSGMASKATNYTRLTSPEVDFSMGPIEYSGDPLDVAINGEGFFKIKLPDDSFGYARKGNFQLNGDGQLIDTNGYPVLGQDGKEIILPDPDVEIMTDGTIWNGEQEVGKVGIFKFADTSVLRKQGGEVFVPQDDSQPVLEPNPVLLQKNLEGANVNMMKTMAEMTSNLRAFEATQKALKIYSDMDSKASDIGQIQ